MGFIGLQSPKSWKFDLDGHVVIRLAYPEICYHQRVPLHSLKGPPNREQCPPWTVAISVVVFETLPSSQQGVFVMYDVRCGSHNVWMEVPNVDSSTGR
jgi:hypothetical protein